MRVQHDGRGGKAIRPFCVKPPDEVFVDLRRHLAATGWPEKETGATQGNGKRGTVIWDTTPGRSQ